MTERLAIDGGDPVRRDPLPLGKGVALLGEEEKAAVLEVLESRSLFRYYGPNLLGKVAAFETEAAEMLGVRHAIAVSSGTAALRTSLAALGIGCGDEVIVPAFTFIATVNAVVAAGAVPVFAEIDDTLGLDAADVAVKITPRTAAIVAVHLENTPCDMEALAKVAEQHAIPILEDTAQSMGVAFRGAPLGSLGALGAFSLQLEKNVTAGEGGLVTTNDDDLYIRAARYQDQGGQFVTSHGTGRGDELGEPFCGENLRMTEIAGAIALAQLRKLPGLLEAMGRNHRRVTEGISGIDGLQLRRSPDPDSQGLSSVSWFLADADLARRFLKALRGEGIPCAQLYRGEPVYATPSILGKRTATNKGGPWHCAEHPSDVEYAMGMCPRTEALVSRSGIAGIGPAWGERDCDDVVRAVRKVASHLL